MTDALTPQDDLHPKPVTSKIQWPEVAYPAEVHGLSARRFNSDAVKICATLQEAGFEAYIVGGGVRDELLNLHPKDLDIATSATPEEIKNLFKRCIIIGRRFRLAHVYMGQHIFEIATFRAAHSETDSAQDSQENDQGMLMRDNVYGTLAEDAIRRDFTINALYYNPIANQIWDYTTGMEDLRQKRINSIGESLLRFTEDPVRMLRAIRIAGKIDFQITVDIQEAIAQKRSLIKLVSKARLFEEYKKLFLSGASIPTFELLNQHQLFEILFPATAFYLKEQKVYEFILQALHNTDLRLRENKPVNPAFLLAIFLWPRYQHMQQHYRDKKGVLESLHIEQMVSDVLNSQHMVMNFPRHLSQTIRDIWQLQPALEQRKAKNISKTLAHRRFRAAYDFLCLRIILGEISADLIDWWTMIQTLPPIEQQIKIEALASKPSSFPGKKRKRSKSKKK